MMRGVPRWSETSHCIFSPPADVPKACISTTRLQESGTMLIHTRILLVVIGAKVNLRQTLLFPVTLPPGTVTQVLPFQYSTLKEINPYKVKVCVSVGVFSVV